MVNKVILVGRLGKDPESKTTANDLRVVHFPLATSERDREGREHTEWHRVVVFGKNAENAQTYLRKGRLIYVEGRIRTRSWTDESGQKRYATEIVAGTFKFLNGSTEMSGSSPIQRDGNDMPL